MAYFEQIELSDMWGGFQIYSAPIDSDKKETKARKATKKIEPTITKKTSKRNADNPSLINRLFLFDYY